jgi:hypothetical protein
MSRIIMVSVVVCFVLQAGPATAQNATDRTAAQNLIDRSEKAITDAILKNDPKAFHSYVVPDSFVVGGEGVMKVADFDKMMSQMNADCKFTKWGLGESTFYWLNDSTVVHTYKATIDGTCQGQPLPAVWASSVWVNKGGKWLGAFHQETEVTQPAAAPKK